MPTSWKLGGLKWSGAEGSLDRMVRLSRACGQQLPPALCVSTNAGQALEDASACSSLQEAAVPEAGRGRANWLAVDPAGLWHRIDQAFHPHYECHFLPE